MLVNVDRLCTLQDSSLPVCLFSWHAEHLPTEKEKESSEPLTVILTFTFGDHTSEKGAWY